MKLLKDVIAGARMIMKYGALIMVILGIVGHAADELEKWQNNQTKPEKNEP